MSELKGPSTKTTLQRGWIGLLDARLIHKKVGFPWMKPDEGPGHPRWSPMQNRGQAERPFRGLCDISDCSPWGKKPQRAAVIPPGTLSARVALLSEFCEGGQAALQREEFGNMEFVKYLARG